MMASPDPADHFREKIARILTEVKGYWSQVDALEALFKAEVERRQDE